MNEKEINPDKIKALILELLDKSKIPFSRISHECAKDTKSATLATGFDPSKGIKALILSGKKSHKNFLICLLGNQRIDMKELFLEFNEPLEFEKKEAIKTKYGLEIGGIPPFGFLFGLDTYFEKSIEASQDIIFALGKPTESISMNARDLIYLIQPKIISLKK